MKSRSPLLRSLVLCAFALGTSAALAGTSGVYVLQGSAYRIAVELSPDESSLTVVEPNKRSEYERVPGSSPPEYVFTNPTNGIRYGLRVVSDREIEAFKPDVEGNVPTTLVLEAATNDAPAETLGDQDEFDELAERYLERAQSDPDNTQVWTMCGAAAMARSSSSGAEARMNVTNAASMLKLTIVDASRSPCPDAIPEDVWAAAP